MKAPQGIDSAFRSAVRERAEAVMTLAGGFAGFYRTRLVSLAASRLAAMYNNARSVEDGGLMSYAADQREEFGPLCR
jgi:hypothetical protein